MAVLWISQIDSSFNQLALKQNAPSKFFFPRVRFGRAEGEYGWNRPSGKLLSQIKISASPPSPYQRTLDTIFGDLLRAFCYSCHSLAKTTKAPSKENPPATGDGDNADLRDSVHFHFTRALTPSESAQILYTKHTHTHADGWRGWCLLFALPIARSQGLVLNMLEQVH